MPDWIWPLLVVVGLLALSWSEQRQRERNRKNWQAINDEWAAREATRPLGNCGRYYG